MKASWPPGRIQTLMLLSSSFLKADSTLPTVTPCTRLVSKRSPAMRTRETFSFTASCRTRSKVSSSWFRYSLPLSRREGNLLPRCTSAVCRILIIVGSPIRTSNPELLPAERMKHSGSARPVHGNQRLYQRPNRYAGDVLAKSPFGRLQVGIGMDSGTLSRVNGPFGAGHFAREPVINPSGRIQGPAQSLEQSFSPVVVINPGDCSCVQVYSGF